MSEGTKKPQALAAVSLLLIITPLALGSCEEIAASREAGQPPLEIALRNEDFSVALAGQMPTSGDWPFAGGGHDLSHAVAPWKGAGSLAGGERSEPPEYSDKRRRPGRGAGSSGNPCRGACRCSSFAGGSLRSPPAKLPPLLRSGGIVGFWPALRILSQLFAQTGGGIPAHPRELKFPGLDYTPPRRAEYRHVLKNGVVGYFVEDHDLPLTNISVTIRAGSYLDPPGKQGLAAAVGSQLRSGGTSRWKAEEFDEEADFLASNLSSFVGSTSGQASVNFLAKDVDKALELFFEMLRRPAFQQDRLDLYKSQQLQQMERRNDRTDSIESREWNRLMRGDNHFTSVHTTKASIESLSREDLIAFHKKYHHPGNFIFAVSGDFKTAEMKTRLEQAMADWPIAKEPVPPVPKPNHIPVPGVYMVHKPDVNQSRVSLGHLGIMRGNPDAFAIDMMNDILGGSGFTSRILSRVRSDEGLAYDAGSSFVPGVYYEGTFRVGFQSKNPTCARATQIVLDEIQRIRGEKVAGEDLETVKNNAVEVFPRFFSSAAAIAGTFADDEFTGRDPEYWDTYRDKIRAVTADDVLRVAQKYIQPDKLVVLAVGNVDEMLKGDPEKPGYSFTKIAKDGKITRIPLPDPLTMIYPKP